MPKSKRNKKVSLTRTKKKSSEQKHKLLEEVRKSVDTFQSVYVFSVQNMRNNKLKLVRQMWKDSRFFFGKNKVMNLALGNSATTEYAKNLSLVGKCLNGQMGLLFTNRMESEVVGWFKSYKEADYARSGNKAVQTVYVKAGPIHAFSHAIEPQLRQLGMCTSLVKGVVTLMKEFKICTIGEVLSPEQCRLLKLFNHKMATFCLSLNCMWSKCNSSFIPYNTKCTSVESRETPLPVYIDPSELEEELKEC